MGSIWFVIWCILTVFQPPNLVTAEEPVCVPGFQSDQLTFSVTRNYLTRGTVLGKVGFTDCTDRTRFLFDTSDKRFVVKTDGVLMVKRAVYLHEGHHDFFIHSWDSQGLKLTIPVSVSMNAADAQVPVLQFPKPGEGLRRRKRDWVIPPLSVTENKRGTYPLKVAQIRSSEDRTRKMFYSITGPGADLPPVGRFTLDRETGILYVTQPLDREETASYTFEAHAMVAGAGQAEEPMEIIVIVIDQNDNKPYFTVEYNANVAEATAIGTEVVKVEAKDDDEPNTDNSELRYRILNQDPPLPTDNMFEINPITGSIRITGRGLDREKYPQYTLTVQASDMAGEGLTRQTKVILTVTDGSSNAPDSSSNVEPNTARVFPAIFFTENNRGPYPIKLIEIRSDEHQKQNLHYSITGPGADQPPVALFTMNRDTGSLYVTQPVDREEVAHYKLQVHVVAESGDHQEVMSVTVKVIDQNDNKPVFSQNTFEGQVAENSAQGSEVIKVEATDSDEPDNANSDIRYRILRQDPQLPSDNMFEINSVTGAISVAGTGLDREKYPQYTLTVQVADMEGEGLSGQAQVIIKVVESQ
ncbi:cadherin-1 isoform X1 [Astatotilapia calliptera]|uniref:cadherin-1 isoform X1 n=1 Tax=Astatotilapia calliptera TaxID=8154 RepID=UPI000E41D88D|nr:cadherin-1-like isoform X1 [Astatotilapia calliptera]XP_026046285.1 cadherin-1-like isoform X1 [Astatotilapia calliptera]